MFLIDSQRALRGLWPGHLEVDELINTSAQDQVVRHSDKANITYLDGNGKARTYNYFLSKDESHTFLYPLQ